MHQLRLIGASEAAKILGLTHGGLTAAVRGGRIKPAARIGTKQTMVFDLEEIEQLAAKRRKKAE